MLDLRKSNLQTFSFGGNKILKDIHYGYNKVTKIFLGGMDEK